MATQMEESTDDVGDNVSYSIMGLQRPWVNRPDTPLELSSVKLKSGIKEVTARRSRIHSSSVSGPFTIHVLGLSNEEVGYRPERQMHFLLRTRSPNDLEAYGRLVCGYPLFLLDPDWGSLTGAGRSGHYQDHMK